MKKNSKYGFAVIEKSLLQEVKHCAIDYKCSVKHLINIFVRDGLEKLSEGEFYEKS